MIPLSRRPLLLSLACASLLTRALSAYDPPPEPFAPGAASAASKLSPDDNMGPMVLVDESLPQLVTLLEKVTGRMAVRSQELPALKVNFSGKGDLSRRQSEVALESLLALNGVAVIPEGTDFLKIVPLAKGPQSEAPPFFTESVANLPPSERVVARLFTLKAAPLGAVEPLLQGLVNKARGGAVMALPAGNALLMTDALVNVQRAEALVASVDVNGEVVFIPLRHTRATEMVTRLKALQASGSKNAFAGEVGFEADETTNQVVVVTGAQNVERVKSLVARFDVETHARTRSEVITLRYVEAERIVKIIESLSKGSGAGAAPSDAASLNGARKAGNAAGQTKAAGGGASAPMAFTSGGNAKSGAGDDPDQGFSPTFTLVSEGRTNSLILFGTDADFRKVRDVVAKVDLKMPQVRIEAIIVEVTLGEKDANGLETLGVGYKTTGVTAAGAPGDLKYNTSTPNLPAGGKPPFAVNGSLKDFSLEMVFNKAREDSKVRILSSPVIVTSHNSPATIKIGQKQPIVTGTASDIQNLNTTRSTVEYRDIGLQLDVSPRIGGNGVVEMDVKQTIENVVGTTVIDGNEQPIIGSREANSYLSAQSDETVVLAGLQSFKETKTKGKVWLLGDIPLIGPWLFQPETNAMEKTELIIFLKPHVMTDADRAPSADTPGLRPESMTEPDAKDRLKRGGFGEMSNEHTVFERKAREEREAAAEKRESAK